VRFDRVLPGIYLITVSANGYGERRLEIEVYARELASLGDVLLDRAVSVSGTFADLAGTPVSSAHVQLVVRETTTHIMDGPGVWTSEDGKFRFEGIGRRRYLIVPRTLKFALTPIPVDTSGGSVENLRIALVPGTSVLVTWSAEDAGKFLAITRDDGLPVWVGQMGKSSHRFTLAPGTYVAAVSSEAGVASTKTFTVGRDLLKIALLP
jgi:hypothetical protein